MNNEIKEILFLLHNDRLTDSAKRKLEDYITNLQEELEYVRKQNNDLRKIYRNTYKRYQEQGNDEMAGYFMAQIDECRTFYVEPVVDYYMLSKQLQEEKEKLKEKCDYLERSNNRREDDILEKRQEIIDLQEENERLKEYIKVAKVSEWFKGNDELDKLLQGSDNDD